MPRRITPKRYAVEYLDAPDAEPRTFEVRVILADLLKAEETGPTYSIQTAATQALAMTAMWVWAAARREGHITDNWPTFRANCVDYEKIGDAEPVDPTRPGADTPSPSPSAQPESAASTSTGGAEQSSTTPA